MKMPSMPRGCPVTLTLIAVNIAMFVGQFATSDQLTNLGLLYGPNVAAGQYWRILTSGFLHGNILHIGFNMYLLYMLGPQLEQGLGSMLLFDFAHAFQPDVFRILVRRCVGGDAI